RDQSRIRRDQPRRAGHEPLRSGLSYHAGVRHGGAAARPADAADRTDRHALLRVCLRARPDGHILKDTPRGAETAWPRTTIAPANGQKVRPKNVSMMRARPGAYPARAILAPPWWYSPARWRCVSWGGGSASASPP